MPMKHRTLVTTQYLENYGAHCENGKFADGHAYWKFKGGTQYVISSIDDGGPARIANAVAFLSAYLQAGNNNCSGKELPVSWEQIGPDWKPENEWEDWVELDLEDHFAKSAKVAG